MTKIDLERYGIPGGPATNLMTAIEALKKQSATPQGKPLVINPQKLSHGADLSIRLIEFHVWLQEKASMIHDKS